MVNRSNPGGGEMQDLKDPPVQLLSMLRYLSLSSSLMTSSMAVAVFFLLNFLSCSKTLDLLTRFLSLKNLSWTDR